MSAKVTTERISGTVAGRYEEYVVDVYYQYDSDREKLSIEDVRRSVWFYESYGSLVIHATVSSIQLIRYDITPSGGWCWNSRLTDKARKSWYPGTATNRHVLYCGSEHCDSLSVRFVQQDHVWIELGMPVCTNDGTYYFGVSRMDEDREESDDKTARLCDYQQKTPCRWEDAGSCDYKYAGDLNSRATKVKAKLIDEENTKVPAYSERWMGETIRGSVAGETASTNFTIVSVNVKLDGTDEGNEESVGAMMGTNTPVKVTFEVHPKALPDCLDSFKVECEDLYEKLKDTEYKSASSAERKKFCVIKKGTTVAYYRKFDTTRRYAAEKLKNLYVICQSASASYKDGVVRIEHPASGAKDLAKYTSVVVNVEITDFPSKKLLGEDKEEMPGAFIPYAADWAYGEAPSKDKDIPFGKSAQEKLVEVFVSYEPSDLPEDEDGGRILEFEAPPDSLYQPAESAGVDQRWIEFVDWWNTRPASQCLSFEGKKRLLLHGHGKSRTQRDRVIRVTHPRSGATDVAKYTVYHVDLDIDSDNDLTIEEEDGFEDAIEEREPGKIISYDQSGICPGQDYRVPLKLKAWGGETNAVVKLEAVASSPRVAEVYKSETGGTKLDLPAYFPADSIPSLYVDGVTNGTVTFTATLINPPKEFPATTTVRPVPGDKLVKDTVAALIIQPISFAPSGNAAVWSSIPNGPYCIGDADGRLFSSLISNQGYRVAWHRDDNGMDDVNVGGCTANAYLNLCNCGALTIISHGLLNEHQAVYFPNTNDGYDEAVRWIRDLGNSGGSVVGMSVRFDISPDGYWAYYYVSVTPQWFEDNWKPGFDKRNSIVLWGSCYSATLMNCCGGRWRSGYCVPTAQGECMRVDGALLKRMNGSIGSGTLRPAGRAYSNGLSSMGMTSVRMEGNPWTTLCPAPVVGNPTFPSSGIAEGEVAFGCLVLDTFLKNKDNMIQVVAGEGVSAIAPLRQEGADYPFGVGFHIEKGQGSVKVRSEARKVYIESATPDGEFSSGKTVDVDRVTPNGGIIEWEF